MTAKTALNNFKPVNKTKNIMQILSIEMSNLVRNPKGQIRFQPLPSGDVEIVNSYVADDNHPCAVIPRDQLHKVAEFLFSQSPEIKAEMAAGRELSS